MPHTFSSTVDPTAEPLGGPRVMLYGHDSFGLGHLRRCLTLAEAIQARYPHASTLIATGSPCATHFPLPDGVDVLKLPAVTKRGASYQPLQLRGPLGPVVDLRCATLRAAFDAFEPDLLLVDHTPVGLHGELLPTLEAARRAGVPCVLGLRDIIDSPLHVARDWSRPEIRRALREVYEDILVYGDPRVFDMREEYPVPPELRARVRHVGYVVRSHDAPSTSASREEPEVLVTTGGGGDGADRIEAYLRSLVGREVRWTSRVVTGPLADRQRSERIRDLAAGLERVEVTEFDPQLRSAIANADAVVSMAGYNTCAELLASDTPAVLLPRTRPRREQFIRAQRLRSLGLAECLVKSGMTEIPAAVEACLDQGRKTRMQLDLRGAERAAELLGALMGEEDSGRVHSLGGHACNL